MRRIALDHEAVSNPKVRFSLEFARSAAHQWTGSPSAPASSAAICDL